jgi:hypothetical protein
MNPKYVTALRNLIILKNNTPAHIRLLENRVKRKLKLVTTKILDKTLEAEYFNSHMYDEVIRNISMDHTRNVVLFGERELLRLPELKMNESIINPFKLESIISDRATRLSDYTLNRVHGELLPKLHEGIRDGQSLPVTMDSLRSEFIDMRDHELMRITRTETHSAYNQSKYEAINNSEAIPGKRWVSSGLDNMRPAHEEADGQTVATDEPFIVDDEELLYPGDPTGSPGNVINCACTMVPDIRYGR